MTNTTYSINTETMKTSIPVQSAEDTGSRETTLSQMKHPLSYFETLMHLFKGSIGSGFLALPEAFMNAGLVMGPIGTAFIATLCVHCMHIIVNCSQLMCDRTNNSFLDYASTAEQTFVTGPIKLRKYSKLFRNATNFYLCVTQLGFCSVYFMFVSNNIKMIVDKYCPEFAYIDYRIYACVMLVLMILMCMTKTLKFLVPFSSFGNILFAICTGIIFYYLCRQLQPVSSRRAFAPATSLPKFFGTSVFAFEDMGLVLPLRNNMRNPDAFGGFTGVLNFGMFITSLLFILMGFFGYLQYGDNVSGSITLNLPQEPLAESVRAILALAMFFTYPIQFFVPIQIMWPLLEKKIDNEKWRYPAQLAFRALFVFITFGVAVIIPHLGLFISLIGAFGGSFLLLILPPILGVVAALPQERATLFLIGKNVFIFLFGVLGLVTGTYFSMEQIINNFLT